MLHGLDFESAQLERLFHIGGRFDTDRVAYNTINGIKRSGDFVRLGDNFKAGRNARLIQSIKAK